MHTLLLADDNITIQRVIALTFASESFRVVTVSDGRRAVESMAQTPPDIVLAGTTLPGMDGYALAKWVRARQALAHVPVLLLTGAFESVDEGRLKACGASGTIEKPIEPTAVIARVKALLGIKGGGAPAPAAGRLVTAQEPPAREGAVAAPSRVAPAGPAAPPKPAQPASWDELREQSGLEPDARSVEAPASGEGDDYFDTLDAAFDTLDQQLAGRRHGGHAARNPAAPQRRPGPPDPRSPGRRPEAGHGSGTPDLRSHPVPQNPVFEVDADWFAADEKAEAEQQSEQRRLAAELGIHEVEVPTPADKPRPGADLDFDFGLGPAATTATEAHRRQTLEELAEAVPADWTPRTPPAPMAIELPEPPPEPAAPEPPAPTPAAHALAVPAPEAPAPVAPVPAASSAPEPPSAPAPVADAFEALLAYEQGERPAPPEVPVAPPAPPAPIVVQAPAPEITEAMLEEIASRVAEKLGTSLFGDQLRDRVTRAVRETVHEVVSDTSERLVRDEIERVRKLAGGD